MLLFTHLTVYNFAKIRRFFSYSAIGDIVKGKSITFFVNATKTTTIIIISVVVVVVAAAAAAAVVVVVVNYRPQTGKDQHYDDFNHAKHCFRFELPIQRFFVFNVIYHSSDEPRLNVHL